MFDSEVQFESMQVRESEAEVRGVEGSLRADTVKVGKLR